MKSSGNLCNCWMELELDWNGRPRANRRQSLRGIATSLMVRITEARTIEESGAGKPHAGIRAEGAG